MNWFWAFVLLCGTSPLFAVSGRIQSIDGSSFEGEVTIDPKLGWVITSDQLGSTNVPFDNLAAGQFNTGVLTNTVPLTGSTNLQFPRGWSHQDVGPVSVSGSAKSENGLFVLSSAGTRIWTPQSDQFHFLYRTFAGNGQMVAQVTNLDAAMGGIMFRDMLDSDSQFVLEAATSGAEGLVFRTRRGPQQRELVHMQGDWHNRDEIKPPCWLKLVRKEKRFTAYESQDDGITWQAIYESPNEWSREIFAGLFVVGGTTNILKSASFASVLIEDENDVLSISSNKPATIEVLLNDGSVLKANSISADQTKVKISFFNTNYAASIYSISRLVYRPIPERMKREMPAGRKGVLLKTGDFFEGDLQSADKWQVKIGSVLFGTRSFPLDRVLAVTVSEPSEMPAACLVQTTDGSIIRARSIAPARNSLLAQELRLGSIAIPVGQLSEVTRSGRANLSTSR